MGLMQVVRRLMHPAAPDTPGPELVTRVGKTTTYFLRMLDGKQVALDDAYNSEAPLWFAIAVESPRTPLAFAIPRYDDWKETREVLKFAIESDNGGIYRVYPNVPALIEFFDAKRNADIQGPDPTEKSVIITGSEPPEDSIHLYVPSASLQEFVHELRSSMWNISRRGTRIAVLPPTRTYSYDVDSVGGKS